jgi:hypothetical protein
MGYRVGVGLLSSLPSEGMLILTRYDPASMGEGGGQRERYGAGATERASGIPSKSRLLFSVSDRRHKLVT